MSISSTQPAKQILDLEKEPLLEKPGGDGKSANAKKNLDDESCSEVFTFFQEAPTSMCSVNKNSISTPVALRNSCIFREFVPSVKEVINQDKNNESFANAETKENQQHKCDAKQAIQENGTSISSDLEISHTSPKKMVSNEKTRKLSEHENFGPWPANDVQAAHNYPRHVPVHVLDASLGMCSQTPALNSLYRESMVHQMGGVHGQTNVFTNPAASATTENQDDTSRSSIHPSVPTFPSPFNPVHYNQDDYRSYLHISSAFSSLILSSLLQNPAAHAAASFAASFWPCTNVEASENSPAGTIGGFPPRQITSAPSMAAIAAATVAAATAWWAAHGLLPFCTPLLTGYSCTPASTTVAPSRDAGQASAANKERKENASENPPSQDQQLDPEDSEALQAHNSASKAPTSSSSDSEESGLAKVNTGLTAPDHEKMAAVVTEVHDSNKAKSRKQVDRSSCGSNTPSSSEVETDVLEKHENDNDELKEPDANHPATESSNRRTRSASNINDSWKEVSEEGRIAFQALFSREVLPQSFSPPHDLKNKEHHKNNIEWVKQSMDEKDNDASRLDLNSKTCGTCSCHREVEKNVLVTGNDNGEEGLLSMGLGQGKLKARRTGFKPYKRCSVEAKECRVANANGSEENCAKRIRLEGDAST
ncbi:protein LATE ELONGATED HYPOCOTYL-like isoform X2 [Malania oleifera]|nr:protein LATE ELONGATED HYPOCOTYL-like isoform X2 [Malania oleifera]XP_057979760.1 protein LATE ELONGATED HYPOCOTYL-like isoform X2 [Malania oleifera]